jgi:hypothetical protein
MGKGCQIKLWKILGAIFFLGVLSAALFPAGTNPMVPLMGAIGVRGQNIYVSIMKANTERANLGLPPIWPSDAPPYTNHVTGKVECFDFDNSTDYFKYIFDEEHYGTDDWEPLVDDFDYAKLAAGKVEKCITGKLLPENNMWTIAKNVTDETDDIIPFLVTRNLDAEYLLAKAEGEPDSNKIPLGETWDTPFSNKGAVIIRKGGGMFKVSHRYATPLVIYNRQSFDANANSKYPLKYLTPGKEVVPIGKRD